MLRYRLASRQVSWVSRADEAQTAINDAAVKRRQAVWVLQDKVFDGGARKLNFFLGHGAIPLQGLGEAGHHQPAMAFAPADSAEYPGHCSAGTPAPSQALLWREI